MSGQGVGRAQIGRGPGSRPARRAKPGRSVEALEPRQLLAQVFTVTNTSDTTAPGSLRWAIGQVNADATDSAASPDQIQFAIGVSDAGYGATTGVWTIAPASALPTVTRPVVVDGYTQAGASPNTLAQRDNAVIKIQIDGTNAGPGADGLAISGGSSTARGLAITRFANGIHAFGAGGDAITGDFIGLDASGTAAAGNTGNGVFFDRVPGTVGGTTPALRNVISGNSSPLASGGLSGSGVFAEGTVAMVVEGNLNGTDRTGVKPVGATADDIELINTSEATIGGTTAGARNVLSGSAGGAAGIVNAAVVVGGTSTGDVIEGNYIGTDVTGTVGLGNQVGINLGAYGVVRGNVISGNIDDGVVAGGANLIRGNLIGTDASGSASLPNGRDGIQLLNGYNTIGGTATEDGNLISGNMRAGIYVVIGTAGHNLIQGNHIGTDLAGTAALGNGDGIDVFGAPGDTIGGTASGAGNVISGNASYGVLLEGDFATARNLVQGNFVGVDASGTRSLGNGRDGVYLSAPGNTIGGNSAGAGNVISGNGGSGINLFTLFFGSDIIQGNFIGTNANGTSPLGNAGDGVTDASPSNLIGGPGAAANTIAFNDGAGVNLPANSGSFNVAILSNSIHDNAKLGIDLGGDGVTPNTPGGPHQGPNLLQNDPVLAKAETSGGSTTVVGTLNSSPNTPFVVQFFANATPDPSGYGQGQVYLGELVSVRTDASGNASFTAVVAASVARPYLSATATDPNGNTSEFSKDIRAVTVDLVVAVASATTSVTLGGPVAITYTVTNLGSSTATGVAVVDALPATLAGATIAASRGTSSLVNGTFTDIVPSLAPGASFTVTLAGTAAAAGQLSNTLVAAAQESDANPSDNAATASVRVARLATTTALSVSPDPATAGQAVTFTATVAAASPLVGPAGVVTFLIDGKVAATVPLVATGGGPTGSASYTTSALAAGRHTVSALYGGDAALAPSASAAVVATIHAPPLPIGPPPKAVEILRYGYHRAPTTLVVEFNEPIDPAFAGNPANYAIVGPRGVMIPVVAAVPTAGGTAVVLQPRGRLNAHDDDTLTIAGGLRSITGVAADSPQVVLVSPADLVPGRLPRARRVSTHAVDTLLASGRLARLKAIAARSRHR